MKTICVYHGRDLDGWMSAAIVKKWFEDNNKENIVLDTNSDESNLELKAESSPNSLHMLGWDYRDEVPDLSKYDKVIMCDISFPKEEMLKLLDKLDANFTWIDHHISAIKDNFPEEEVLNDDYEDCRYIGLRDIKFAACELAWKYFFPNDKMPEIVRLLGRYDCFGHKGTDEEQEVLEFQYAARADISNYSEAYKYLLRDLNESLLTPRMIDSGKYIYRYLCTEAKQTYSKAFPVEFKQTGPPGIEKYKDFLCVNQERFNPINFGINYHKDGYDGFACFWLKNGQWTFSLYNDNGEVDCSEICKGFGGGGHKGASGFVCSDKQMLSLINQ